MNEPSVAELHVTAYLERLRSHPLLASIVFQGELEKPIGLVGQWSPPQKYALVYPDLGRHSAERLDGREIRVQTIFTVTSVGLTQDQALAVSGAVDAMSVNWRPQITGRRCWRMKHPTSRPFDKEKDGDRVLHYGTSEFVLLSTPAPIRGGQP